MFGKQERTRIMLEEINLEYLKVGFTNWVSTSFETGHKGFTYSYSNFKKHFLNLICVVVFCNFSKTYCVYGTENHQ